MCVPHLSCRINHWPTTHNAHLFMFFVFDHGCSLIVFAWVTYQYVVSSSGRTWVHGSHRSFPFLGRTACALSSSLFARGSSDSPRCVPHTPRSHSWSLCGNLSSSPPTVPSFPLLMLLPLLPFAPPPSPSSLPEIVPSGEGRAQLSLALRGTPPSHNLCCWLC